MGTAGVTSGVGVGSTITMGGMVTSGVGVGIAVASDVFVGVGGTITSGVAVGAFDTISVLTSVSLDAEPQLLKTETLNIIEIMHNSIL